jgi:Trp operon repressor
MNVLHWNTSFIHVCFSFSHIDFFIAELCEVLKMFMTNSEDVDLLDRAHIYHSLLVSLSNKKVCICTHLLLFYFIMPHVQLWPQR